MKSLLMSAYLIILSLQDIGQKKVSLWLLILAIVGGSSYALIFQRGWNIFLDILPGAVLCLIAFFIPKSLGMGDGMVGLIYGLVYGWLDTCMCLSLAFTLAAAAGGIMCVGRSAKRIRIPFIPFFTIIHVGMQL